MTTLDAEDYSEIIRIAQQIAAETVRNLTRGTGGANMPLPIVRLCTVGGTANGGAEVTIRADGDTGSVPAVNASGDVLEPGDRVLASWLPPLGVYVTSRISRAERGLWTPLLGGTGANGTGATSFGHYTRVGHRVHAYGVYRLGAGSAMVTSGIATISGLPYPLIADGDGIESTQTTITYWDNSAAIRIPGFGIIAEGASVLQLFVPYVFATPASPFQRNLSTNDPFTWATSDAINLDLWYDTDS